MKHMSLAEITTACAGTYHGDPALASKEVSSVVIDSRLIEKDTLFVAMKGARVDGHDFIPQTIEAGALCALSEKDLGEVTFPYIQVESCAQALKDIAEYYRKGLSIPVVGITGSVGKTSTKEMIASILAQKYNVLKTAGNFNNEIGLPLTVFRIRDEHEVAVLEMGINHFGEMTRLAKVARPDIAVITNIGTAHLENLGSRDGILKAKTEMVDFIQPEGTLILNGEDDKLSVYSPANAIKPVLFGLDPSKPFYATDIEAKGLFGTNVTIHTPDFEFRAHIAIPGDHMVLNALAGCAVGHTLGLNVDEMKAGIENLKPLAGRNNLIQTADYTIIDDCYNANPVSMKSSLDVLAMAATRKVAILGDMFELGTNELAMHREVGEYAAKLGIDLLISIGELTRAMHEAASVSDKTEAYHFNTKTDFIQQIPSLLSKNDTILIKASHGMHLEEIVNLLSKAE